jgi:hypothetical protein
MQAWALHRENLNYLAVSVCMYPMSQTVYPVSCMESIVLLLLAD